MSTPTEPPLMSSPEPSTPSSSTTPSTPTTTTSTSTTSSNSTYQIPNMNVYINKTTCRDLNLIHHPHTETNIHPATLLARIHFNAEQLFYLRSHSAAYPIVTTLFALPQEDWFECRIYPYPNGIPPMMMPPPPITTPLLSSSTTPTTPTLNLPPLPIPTPLVHSSSLHSLFMNQNNSPIDTSHKKSSQQHIHSPLPLINIHDQWYLRRAQSPVTSTTTTSSITSTPSSLSSSPSFQSFLQGPHHDNTLSNYPYPTTTPPTNINIQHINYQIPNQPTTTTNTTTTTTNPRKRKSSNKKHKDKKRITRSHTRKQEGEEEEEEEESELSTPSDMEEEDDSRPSSPDPLALPTTDAELFKRKKVLKKVYKKRYQQKKSIKRKIARFHTTGDKAVVIFVTRNSQRKFGYDVEFYNPITSSNDFMNRFWKEQSSLVESYLQHHYVHKKDNNNNNKDNMLIKHEEEDNSGSGYVENNSSNYTTPTNKYTTIGSTDVGVPQQYINHVETNP